MRPLFSSLTSAHALLLMLSLLALGGVLVGVTLVEGWIGQTTVVAVSVLALLLGAKVVTPTEVHRQRSIRYAVLVFAGLVPALVVARPLVDQVMLSALQTLLPDFAQTTLAQYPDAPIALALVLVFLMYAVTLLTLRSPPPLGRIARDPHLREASYTERRATFVKVLESHLGRVDEDLRWHQRDFVELRAEVDIRNGNRARRRVVDLVEAIKQNRDADIFVVIGVPGAGKSVALRKSCSDLLAAQRPDERIPIYVNLKEWGSDRRWTADDPPTHDEFADFVRRNVRDRLPDRSRAFFEEHFDRLRENGEIFFMFDSFDEIPGILDADETSRLLDAVSGVVVAFLRSATNARGVIASRHYRRPRLGQERHAQLDVRPFAERQIGKALRLGASRSAQLERILFVDRPELGAIARNPFALSLILLYWENAAEVPPSQSALYAAYIARSLADAAEVITALGLDAKRLEAAMADISWTMFESDRRGLEMSVHELRDALGRDDIDAVVDALVAARLVRKAPRTQAVSFVHRRFNEYFLVSRWLTGERIPPFEAIPTDSRFRDALVLYAEVAPEADASALALSCWREIEPFEPALLQTEGGIDRVLRAIYALRFLGEAFRARPGPVTEFRDVLGGKVRKMLLKTDDLLHQKIAVEAVGLLAPSDAEAALLAALRSGVEWIQETAFGACRYLGALPARVEHALTDNLLKRSQLFILSPDKDLNYLLTVSDVFRPVLRRFRAARIDTATSLLAAIALIATIEVGESGFGLTFVTLVAFCSLVGVFGSGKVIRLEIERGTMMSPILTMSEFLLGTLRATPVIMLFFMAILFLTTVVPTPAYLDAELHSSLAANDLSLTDLAILIPICFTATPFFGLTQLLTKAVTRLNTFWDRLSLRNVAISLFAGLVTFGFIFTIFYLVSLFPKMFYYFGAGGMTLAFIKILAMRSLKKLRDLRAWRHDRLLLGAATVKFVARRADIAATFDDFETARARGRYTDWVEREATAHDHLTALADIVANPWPGGRRPNRNNDAASTRLAQLDERWLKLDV